MRRHQVAGFLGIFALAFATDCRAITNSPIAEKIFRAGAYAIDVSPKKLPVIVNGGFLQSSADKVNDPLFARCLVLDDGMIRLAIVVVDSCMMPRDLIDEAKGTASKSTGIPIDRMLISATHTHSAPSAMGALGTPPDPDYVELLPFRIAEGIERAVKNLAPAKIGWAVVDDYEHTHCRRWIRRPDKMIADPFGTVSVRANMHPGYQNADTIGPSGPVDPGLSVLSIRSLEGRPIALLANYSMHYFGAAPVSADYYGRFSAKIATLVGAGESDTPFVGMMSQGTSGDQQWMDYGQPKTDQTLFGYADAVAQRAFEAYQKVQYREWVPLAMAEATLTLGRRVPDQKRLESAQRIVAKMPAPIARNQVEVYAKEAIDLHDDPVRELKLQAIRIGDLGIVAIPNEVYAITGLKIKGRSPLQTTFTVELANGSEGYVPPPEQHKLGGYTTWPARTAALEVDAEPKIVETVLGLLENVSNARRRDWTESLNPYARAILAAKPVAYWRMGEIVGPQARDASAHEHHGLFESGIALYLDGAPAPGLRGEGSLNRSPHFAGGRMRADLAGLGAKYSVALWFWNGLPNNTREVTGYLVSRGQAGAAGDYLGIGGTRDSPGRLVFSHGDRIAPILTGRGEIQPKTWHFAVLVRDDRKVAVYVDGAAEPELAGEADAAGVAGDVTIFLGGRSDNVANFEGKIDETAVFDRSLSATAIRELFEASKSPR
jgi:hypothetical protein